MIRAMTNPELKELEKKLEYLKILLLNEPNVITQEQLKKQIEEVQSQIDKIAGA